MTRRATARRIDLEAEGAITFDATLAAYLTEPCIDTAEDLLRAASLVLGSTIEIDPVRAETVAKLTGTTCDLTDYDDAARAVRHWFAVRHLGFIIGPDGTIVPSATSRRPRKRVARGASAP